LAERPKTQNYPYYPCPIRLMAAKVGKVCDEQCLNTYKCPFVDNNTIFPRRSSREETLPKPLPNILYLIQREVRELTTKKNPDGMEDPNIDYEL
jgi:hypothetical protein